MNIRKRLEHLANVSAKDRAFGRTKRTAQAAVESGGIVVAATLAEARHIEHQHKGVIAKSMEVNLEGYSGPFYFDHHAVETMFLKAANKIEELERENEKLRDKVERVKEILGEDL